MTRKQKRLTLIVVALALFGSAVGLIGYALRGNISYFRSPSALLKRPIAAGVVFNLGGLVEKGSVVRKDSMHAVFVITDKRRDVKVVYSSDEPLPDLFREGQGVIATGSLNKNGVFLSTKVLAKHDERYMPRQVAEALKKQGLWKGTIPKAAAGEAK
jgi:cytochrome c-type biogenesis protein CcmE